MKNRASDAVAELPKGRPWPAYGALATRITPFPTGFRPPRGAQLLMFAPKTADSAVFGAIWSLRSRPPSRHGSADKPGPGNPARHFCNRVQSKHFFRTCRLRPSKARGWVRLSPIGTGGCYEAGVAGRGRCIDRYG